MERVKKGERYWLIRIDVNGVKVYCYEEGNWEADKRYFEDNNYFATEEEAEAVAKKLRAVLKGAEVIEMPSEEGITKHYAAMMGKHKEYDLYTSAQVYLGVIEWLKSKIVK